MSEYNNDKIDDATLALMYLVLCDDSRAWKGFDWDTLSRLHEKGYLHDPVGKQKSVRLTPEGMERCERLFNELFG